jgi:hypothetical protein
MGRVTSIAFTDRVQQRDAPTAVGELRRAVTMLNFYSSYLARHFPGVIAIGVMDSGSNPGAFAIAPSRQGNHVSPVAPAKLKALARIVGRLPRELRDAFETELAAIPRSNGSPVNFVTAAEIAADDESFLA